MRKSRTLPENTHTSLSAYCLAYSATEVMTISLISCVKIEYRIYDISKFSFLLTLKPMCSVATRFD